MPREWTDWATPDAQVSAQALITDAFGLLALNELISLLTCK